MLVQCYPTARGHVGRFYIHFIFSRSRLNKERPTGAMLPSPLHRCRATIPVQPIGS
ncbi:MAG: hypothetical protein K6E86_07400 [Bacteroidales bacterium]|nr:hypothetical protein [Bacteroidales bacterium]